MSDEILCPCGSKREYQSCCGPYISGLLKPPTAEVLMRSRYTAYTQKNDDYLLRTWHPDTRPMDEPPSDDADTVWTRLEIVRTEAGNENDSEGVVEFIAHCQVKGVPSQLHEISHFRRDNGDWIYLEGEGQQPHRRTEAKIGRNEPCPCGSGKKYKKCCGR